MSNHLSSHIFNPIALCHDLAKPFNSGHLKVSSNGIDWNVSIIQGRLQYAVHSAQSLDTLEYHALKLGQERAVEALRNMSRAELTQIKNQPQTSRAGWLSHAVDWLFKREALSAGEVAMLTTSLSEDALESMLWLTQGSYQWELSESTHGIHAEADALPPLDSLVKSLERHLKIWQGLRPLITSPHEQPYCINPVLLQQPVPNGMLSQNILSTLVKLMQGASIRQLSVSLKQDTLRVAQLLYPYIQHQVLALHAPAAPYDQLPVVPSRNGTAKSQISIPSASAPTKSAPAQASHQAHQAHQMHQAHKIVCIDDSPAMLNTIQRYLGRENFEVVTVENPMESLTALFGMKPDLILMDVSMPGINGNRLCQILRRSDVFKALPIIMVSGNTGTLDKAKAQASGATDYLTKPFSKEELLAIVRTHLSSVPA